MIKEHPLLVFLVLWLGGTACAAAAVVLRQTLDERKEKKRNG